MKRLYVFLFVFLFCVNGNLFTKDKQALDATPPVINKTQRYLNYSASLGLGYQSLVLYEGHNNAMESFLTLQTRVSYYPLSFLALSYYLGFGVLSFHNLNNLPQSALVNFPSSVSRFNIENSLSLEFYTFLNSSSLLYLGIGASYLYMSSLKNTNITSSADSFANSERHIPSLRLALGSRFALYNHTMLAAELYVMLPFTKTRSWSAQGPSLYKQAIFGFQMDIGFFN